MNGEPEERSGLRARFSTMQIALAGMVGAVILVVLLIAAASVS